MSFLPAPIADFLTRVDSYRKADLTRVPMAKAILWLTVPALAGNAVQSLVNVIIMYYVSRLGTAAIAAVSVAGNVAMLVFTAIIGLSVGATALIARYHGARDEINLRRAIVTTLAFSAVLAVVMAVVGTLAGKPILRLLGAEPDVVDLAYAYVRVFCIGGFGLIFLNNVSAALRGVGDSLTPTALVILAVLLDVVLEPLFIFGVGPIPPGGVGGAALGAVVAYSLATTISLVILKRRHLPPGTLTARNVNGRMGGQIVTIGVPASLQMLIRVVAQMILIGFAALGGTAALAAYGVGFQLTGLILMPSFAFAMSAAILTGQNLGARQPERAEKSAMVSVAMCAAAAAVIVAVEVIFARRLVTLFDDTPAVVDLGVKYLYICAPSFLVVPFGMILSRAMGGAGVSWAPLIGTAIVLLGVRIPMAYLFTHTLGMGTVGVFWAIAIPNVLEGLATLAIFKTGVWKHKKL